MAAEKTMKNKITLPNHSHSIENGILYSDLTDEEIYFVLRFAGRVGYSEAMKRLKGRPLQSLRRWFIWFGGWEKPELSQWDRGCRAWDFTYGPWPLSLFGHRITFFGHWMHWKWGRGWCVLSGGYAHKWPTRFYWSPDGTPGNAETRIIARWDGLTARDRAARETDAANPL